MLSIARPRVPGLLFALVFAGVPAGPANLVPSRVSSLTTAVAIAEPVKIGGVWKFTVELEIGTGHPTVTLKQDGEKLTGHYSSQQLGEAELTGTVKGSDIKFTFGADVQGAHLDVTYTGTIESKDSMKGTVNLGGLGDGTFTAKRQ
jgi:hypothetical protein